MVSKSQKPLIAQNPQFDITFLYEQFIGPLPDSFIQFCTEFKKHFPTIYDTKCILIQHKGAQEGAKTTLDVTHGKLIKDKGYESNIQFAFDTSAHDQFGAYAG